MNSQRSGRLGTILMIGVLVVIFIVFMLLFPQEGLTASLRGLSIWWDVLFPALFPFFVISEMLLGFGIVHFIGTLFDPMMRPIFRIPGIGGFVMAMGFASGYPVGARLTSQLWEQGLVTREEGERLVSFTTSSDPIFLIGAVSVGFFHDASLAVALALAHYGGAMIIGLGMRYHGRKQPGSSPAVPASDQASPYRKSPILLHAFHAMHEARTQDGRSFGMLLSESIKRSLNMMFVVGGLVVFFSVLLELLTTAGVMPRLHTLLNHLLHLLHLPAPLAESLLNGLFEVTLGAKTAGETQGIPLMFKAAAAAFVLSWGGLSVHAQVVSILSKTNMRYTPFVWARFFHGIVASALVLILWKPLQFLDLDASVFGLYGYEAGHLAAFNPFLRLLPMSGMIFIAALGSIILLFALYKISTIVFRTVIDYDGRR